MYDYVLKETHVANDDPELACTSINITIYTVEVIAQNSGHFLVCLGALIAAKIIIHKNTILQGHPDLVY